MAKYTFYVTTGYVGSKRDEVIDIPDDELEGMTEEEKDKYIYEYYFQDWLNSNSDSGWYKTE